MAWKQKLPDRVTELADQIEPRHTALLMVDMQNDFVHDDGVFVKEWQKTNRWAKEIIPQCQRTIGVRPSVVSRSRTGEEDGSGVAGG